MAGFAKFDPQAFLEKERRTAASKPKALAGLATLAVSPLHIENQDVGYSDTSADPQYHAKNQKGGLPPAKAAKIAKVESPVVTIKVAPWDDAEEERAAIVEYDGGAPRVWAEAFSRLDPNKAPADVPTRRWVSFINDCGRFLDDGWADRAVALGWGPLDLFGCDRVKPFARIDRAGLLWLLNGQKLLALAANAASITTASGGKLTFRKCLNEAGRLVAWELDK